MGPTVEHKHTLVVDRDAWYMKVYQKVWDGNPDTADFCKLFWAFFPPFLAFALVVNITVRPFAIGLVKMMNAHDRRKAAKPNLRTPKPPKLPRERSIGMQRLLLRLEVIAVRILVAFKGVVFGIKRVTVALGRFATSSATLNMLIGRTLGMLFFVGCIGVVALGLGLAVWQAVIHFTIAISVIGLLTTGAMVIGALIFAISAGYVAWVLMPIKNYVLEPTGKVTKKGALGFIDMLRIGYVGVKSNTCPRIEVK